jgi:hypothetical protein
VVFELPRCSEPPYDDAQLIAHVELELSVRGFRSITPLEADTSGRHFRLELELPECSSDAAELTLSVLDPDRRWLVQRRLPLSDIPFEARPRALALAIAEALDRTRPSTAGTAAAPAPLPRLPPAPAALPEPPAAPTETPSLQLGVAAQHRTPLLASHPFWGGELSVSRFASRAWDQLSWVAAFAFATNTTDTRLGQMRTDWWSAGLGLDFRESGLLELAIGPRLGLGYVSSRPERATRASASRTDAFIVLWGVGTELALPLGSSWRLRGTLELEQPSRGLVLTAGGQRSLSLEGWLLTSGLGLAFRP